MGEGAGSPEEHVRYSGAGARLRLVRETEGRGGL
jgi:hypothetical protein